MYQYGLGVPQDFAQALAWYRMAADQGNKTAMENLATVSQALQGAEPGIWEAADASAHRAAETQAARRLRIADLQRQISELETDAEREEGLAAELDHDAPGATNGVNALGTMGAPQLRKEADNFRAEAARLRGELAGLDVLSAAANISAN
jgi:uncharacterized protein